MNVLELLNRIDEARRDVELLSAWLELARQDEDIDGNEYIIRRTRSALDSAAGSLRGASNELREVK